ncbi:DUF305 domain-containing protein [Micromonospora sp. DT233]|uniref:DUF305 domain-containing protein n=1 Tax=Micromonospora sp. DT233 TaxID=3393432 RepID=UPI003CF8A25F
MPRSLAPSSIRAGRDRRPVGRPVPDGGPVTAAPPRLPRTSAARVAVPLVGALLAVVASVTGCRAQPPDRPSPAPPAQAGADAAPLGGTDAAWIQLMIPMNEQVLKALDLAPGRSADTGVGDTAALIAAARRAELDDLRRLRDGAGLPTANAHEGHDLPGMVVPADLDALRALRGPAFDRALRQTLREHVEQGARLADSERANGSDARTRQLAERVGRSRASELDRLTGKTGRPGPSGAVAGGGHA